ncbi:hypothetical protein AQJ46_43980 [Streptomyces canus]|uniref:Peptidase inhibitor family I36 protein n=1 Tax=Streptomyces canus TaxID=58343 RepID=A0A101RM65_9ACTN|nr:MULTISPECIES: hypothetical protein [Streptomyces]KUN58167.1 hypothetical protein AQJ46_43980 [Streptomyces canus]MDI5904751.1 hypothetical protein [Streptomyces sp. 12257]
MTIRKIVSGWSAFAAIGIVVASAPSAAAEPAVHGCAYPRVCFYLTEAQWNANSPTAAYQDADYNQTLGSNSKGADVVYNSRNDDTVLLRVGSTNNAICLNPNGAVDNDASVTVTAIRIRSTPAKCSGIFETWPSS